MEANEFRIGNIVWDDYSGEMIVDAIRIDSGIGQVCLKKRTDLPSGLYIVKNIQPIPLTEERLIKFGFELFPWGYVKNEILIKLSRKPELKFWIEIGNGTRIKLPYVHIVQNFFALTGKELTI